MTSSYDYSREDSSYDNSYDSSDGDSSGSDQITYPTEDSGDSSEVTLPIFRIIQKIMIPDKIKMRTGIILIMEMVRRREGDHGGYL